MTAIGYAGGDPTKVNKAGDTMTGLLLLSGDPVSGLGAATKNYTDSHGGGGGSVSSVFGRSGAVTAQSGDYTAAQVGADAAGAASAALTAANSYTDGQVGPKANDSAVVHNTGNENVGGIKTFTAVPVLPAGSYGGAGNSAVGDAAAAGSAATLSHSDHKHGREGFGAVTAQTSYGAASADGVATTVAHSDHTHGTVALGTTGTTAAAGNDARLSDARTPTAHAASHGSAGSDPVSLNASQITAGALLPIRMSDTEIQNLISGAWWGAPDIGATGTLTMPAAGTACFMCLAPARDCTLAGLIAEITTQDSTGVVRFGLATDVSGQPGVWLNDFGTAVATSIAMVQPGSTPSVALTGGTRYWVAVIPQSTTSGLVMRTHSSNERHIPISLSAAPGSLNVIRNGYTVTGIAGALSIGSGVGTLAVASVPLIAAKLT